MVPHARARSPTEAAAPPAGSAPVHQQQGPVVVAASRALSTSRSAPPSKLPRSSRSAWPSSRSMPRPMSRARRLDHAVGVEHQRVAAAQHAGRARELARRRSGRAPGPRSRAAPSGRRRRASWTRRRVPGGPDSKSPVVEVEREVDRRWRSPPPSPGEQVVVGGGQELGRPAAPSAGRRRPRTAAAPGCRPARPCPETSTTRRRGRPVATSRRDQEVAGERRAAGRAQRGLGVPAVAAGRAARPGPGSGRAGRPASTRPCVAGDAEPRTGGTR